jgi:2-methylisocitrate lyase-like PEP mutase family enzyme
VSGDTPLVLPGAYDALSARLIERAGFEAFVIGGFPLLGSRYALPDIGLAGLGEMASGVADILSATTLPVLVDADHGYGDAKNVTRTVRTYEKMGVAALLLEDQRSPKRCGHAAGKSVVPAEEMETKIRAAVAARNDSSLFLIARTDARAIEGLDATLRRAERYINAGADGIFVEAPESEEELVTIARSFDVPQMCNMLIGGTTPILSNRDLHAMGFQMIVHGTTLIKRVAKVLEQTLAQLKEDTLDCNTDEFFTLTEFMRLNGADEWAEIEEKFS